MIGTTLSHYSIEAELGRGGMGIVYKAQDTKLDRTVAIKVLPSAALASADDRERFYREAKSAAQLHHPNIASVFEIDEAVPSDAPHGTQPSPFIAMEFISGKTLQYMVREGPLKLSDAVKMASQVAEALKAAHAKNIVHRDIKSANVMITEDGIAKVLDFGLAKTNQSTMLTRMGSTLGTVSYMSPEQARGQEVDGRSDLYSLGTMLYEMIAGRLPFAGEYEQAVVYSILNEPPEPLTALRTGVPMDLERITGKLLSKDAEYRYQSAAELLVDLKSLDLGGSGMSRRSLSVSRTETQSLDESTRLISARFWQIAVAAVLLIGVGALVAWVLKTPQPEPRLVIKSDMYLGGVEVEGAPALSDDGAYLAFLGADSSGNRALYVHEFRTGQLRRVLDTEGGYPFHSPDSRWLVIANNDGLWKVPAAGGRSTCPRS